MAKISVRMTDGEEIEIRKIAKRNNISMSEFLRNRIFSNDENYHQDDFLYKQKICEIEKQQQEIIEALFEMTKRIRFGANISVSLLQKISPNGWQKEIAKIEKSVNIAMAESGEE